VIERAAVVGKVFYLGAVRHLSPDGEPQALRNHLKGLIGKDLVRPVSSDFSDEETYRFRHILIRDTAYDGLSKALRAEFHERLATWLERYAGDRIKQYEEILAYHLEQACRYRDELGLVDERSHRLARRAVERLARGAHRAYVRGDMPAAAALFRRARQLMPEDDPMRVDLSIRLGHALVKVGSLEEAGTVLDDALSRTATMGDQGLEAHALLEHTFARISTETGASLQSALGEAEQAIALFEKLNDDQGLSTAWSLVAEIHNIHGRFAASREALERALVHARSIGDEREVSWAIWGIVGSMAHGPTPADEVVRFAESQLEWARVEGHRWVEAGALMHLGQARAILGHFDEARRLVAESRAIYNDLGLGLFAAALSQLSGWVEWYAGELTGAEAELRRGYEALDALKEKGYLSTVAAQLAEVLYEQGRDEEAERYTRTSETAASKDDLVTQMLWRGTRAKIRARRGAPVEAERLAREAVALAERTDVLNMRGLAVVDLAEVLLFAGRFEEAADHLEEAVRVYTRKGNLVALRKTRARLDELRRGNPSVREVHRSDDPA
jgi:tetratricopeptide (TPR) repeat protein